MFRLPKKQPSSPFPHPSGLDVVIFARNVAVAAKFTASPGLARLFESGWRWHHKVKNALEHPELRRGLGWHDAKGSFWIAQRQRRRRVDGSGVRRLGLLATGRAPDHVVVAPTVLDVPVEPGQLPPVPRGSCRTRVLPAEVEEPDMHDLFGVRYEMAITASWQKNSVAPSYDASLRLGGPLLVPDGAGGSARKEVLTGDLRHLSAFPSPTASFIGAAVCRLYGHLLDLGVRACRRRTGNFRQLGQYIVMPRTGFAAVYMEVPTEWGHDRYVVSNEWPYARPCTVDNYAAVVSSVDRVA